MQTIASCRHSCPQSEKRSQRPLVSSLSVQGPATSPATYRVSLSFSLVSRRPGPSLPAVCSQPPALRPTPFWGALTLMPHPNSTPDTGRTLPRYSPQCPFRSRRKQARRSMPHRNSSSGTAPLRSGELGQCAFSTTDVGLPRAPHCAQMESTGSHT